MWTNTLNMQWKKSKLANRNTLFEHFLLTDIEDSRAGKEFSWMCDIRGGSGSGKSTFALILIDLLLRNNPKRWVAYYKANDTQINQLNKISPSYMQGKFVSINNIIEINSLKNFPPYEFIFYVDEAGLDASAKEALKKEMRPLVKMAKKSRHLKVIIIMLDQANSILKDYRTMCHFHFYKRISDDYIQEYKDWFAKKYKRQLLYLEDYQIAFRCNYKYFRDETKTKKNNFVKRGLLSYKMEDYIPWYLKEVEDLSQYLKNENIDHDYAQYEKIKIKINEFAIIIKDEFGDELKKPKMKNIMVAWLEDNYPIDFYLLEKYTTKIYNKSLLFIYQDKSTNDKINSQSIQDSISNIKTGIDIGIDFPEYCRTIMEKRDKINEIFYHLLQGNTQRDIASILNIGKTKINSLIKTKSEREIGYTLEDWFAFNNGGGDVAHESHGPDYIHPENGNVYSLKYRYCGDKTLTFYQEIDFGPEYRHIKKNIKKNKKNKNNKLPEFYFVVLYSPRWNIKLQIKKLSPTKDDDKVNFKNIDFDNSIDTKSNQGTITA